MISIIEYDHMKHKNPQSLIQKRKGKPDIRRKGKERGRDKILINKHITSIKAITNHNNFF